VSSPRRSLENFVPAGAWDNAYVPTIRSDDEEILSRPAKHRQNKPAAQKMPGGSRLALATR